MDYSATSLVLLNRNFRTPNNNKVIKCKFYEFNSNIYGLYYDLNMVFLFMMAWARLDIFNFRALLLYICLVNSRWCLWTHYIIRIHKELTDTLDLSLLRLNLGQWWHEWKCWLLIHFLAIILIWIYLYCSLMEWEKRSKSLMINRCHLKIIVLKHFVVVLWWNSWKHVHLFK